MHNHTIEMYEARAKHQAAVTGEVRLKWKQKFSSDAFGAQNFFRGVPAQAHPTPPLTETHSRILEHAEQLGFGEHDNSAVFMALRRSQPN